MSLLDSCLALCSVRLEQFSVALDDSSDALDFMLGSWAVAAPRLQELRIEGISTLTTWVTLGGMTSLRCLHVDVQEWQLGRAVALPASLTRLRISSHEAEEMPAQVGQQ